jgi:hypothetical protein
MSIKNGRCIKIKAFIKFMILAIEDFALKNETYK